MIVRRSKLLLVARAAFVTSGRWRGSQAFDPLLYLVDVVGGWVGGLEILTNRLEVDSMLREQGLILPEAVDELPLLGLLLPAAGRLGSDDLASDASLDTVGTRLLFVTANLALLTENTAVAPGQLDGGFGCNDMARGGKGEGGHVSGRRTRHSGLRIAGFDLICLDSGQSNEGRSWRDAGQLGQSLGSEGQKQRQHQRSERWGGGVCGRVCTLEWEMSDGGTVATYIHTYIDAWGGPCSGVGR